MIIAKGTEIVDEFIRALNDRSEVRVLQTPISKNVFEYSGRNKVLLYVKGRAQYPYRWGVTKNVIQRLRGESKPWIVILLFESHEKGYLLTTRDTDHYIDGVWPLGADGDYKLATGSYLANNFPLYSLDSMVGKIESISDL